jgi:hypothetical protein
VLTANGGLARLLRNDQATGHHWLRVRLEGARSNRDAVGAWVTLESGGRRQRRQVMPTRSYLSQVEAAVTFGLGTADGPAAVAIRWPDGSSQVVTNLAVDRLHTIRQDGDSSGSGYPEAASQGE